MFLFIEDKCKFYILKEANYLIKNIHLLNIRKPNCIMGWCKIMPPNYDTLVAMEIYQNKNIITKKNY